MLMNICTYTGKQGKQCKAMSVKDGKFCYWHTNELKEDRLQASTKGGENRRLQAVYGDAVELNKPRDAEEDFRDGGR